MSSAVVCACLPCRPPADDEGDPPGWSGLPLRAARRLQAATPARQPSDSTLPAGAAAAPLQAISGDKLPDKSQGPLTGMLKDMSYTESQVFKF